MQGAVHLDDVDAALHSDRHHLAAVIREKCASACARFCTGSAQIVSYNCDMMCFSTCVPFKTMMWQVYRACLPM